MDEIDPEFTEDELRYLHRQHNLALKDIRRVSNARQWALKIAVRVHVQSVTSTTSRKVAGIVGALRKDLGHEPGE